MEFPMEKGFPITLKVKFMSEIPFPTFLESIFSSREPINRDLYLPLQGNCKRIRQWI